MITSLFISAILRGSEFFRSVVDGKSFLGLFMISSYLKPFVKLLTYA